MKRFILNTAKIILFLAAFLCGVWYFFPWEYSGKFALSKAYSYLNSRGMRLSYSDVTGTEGGFTIRNLSLNGAVKFSFSAVTLRPQLAASVLSLSPVCDITFTGGQVQLGQVINFGDGGTLLTYAPSEVLMENLRTNGEFSVSGYLTVNPGSMRIVHADALLNVPEEFSQNMNMLASFLPLENEGGRWYLRRK